VREERRERCMACFFPSFYTEHSMSLEELKGTRYRIWTVVDCESSKYVKE
jgi:hypothetical protein